MSRSRRGFAKLGRRSALALIVMATLVIFVGCGVKITITEPVDGSKQPQKVVVKGTISNPKAKIYLFVKALPDGPYMLQPSIWVREEWDGTALLGSSYEPPGGAYEIFAIVSKKGLELSPGPIDALPEKYDAQSNVVKVARTD